MLKHLWLFSVIGLLGPFLLWPLTLLADDNVYALQGDKQHYEVWQFMQLAERLHQQL